MGYKKIQYRKSGEDVNCSFCGKNLSEVDYLFAGPAVYICDKCIDNILYILDKERKSEMNETFLSEQ